MTADARARRPIAAPFALWLGALALLTACNEGHKKMAPPPLESNESKASKASPWNELAIPGVELYVEYDEAHRPRGSARVDGASARLRGKDAFDAVRAKAGGDPATLATLAMFFLDEDVAGKKPWTGPGGAGAAVPEQQAIARPPALSGDTLVYWRAHVQLADLVRCRVTLPSGRVACELGGNVLAAERTGADPAAAAKQYLASDNVNERIRGIEALGKVSGGNAREQLIDMALNKHDQRERQAAVTVLGKTGGTGVAAALGRVLLYDQYPEVRQAAATALGELGDPAGRDALQRAANGDANGRVQVLAADALKRIK